MNLPELPADEETPCPGDPITPGVEPDGKHCGCWYDGGPCCRCGDPAEGGQR